MTLDTMMVLGAELQHIQEEKRHLQGLASGGSPALLKELKLWKSRETQVLNSIAIEEAYLEDRYEGYARENACPSKYKVL